MASGTKKAMKESSSAARDSSTSQPPQAGLAEAAADPQRPICLRNIKKTACVAYCMHCFCFNCIDRWSKQKDECPVCKQLLNKLLYLGRASSGALQRHLPAGSHTHHFLGANPDEHRRAPGWP
uniref:RING-type E3 ubiquitin transferase n=1 Tax=Strix occidentalis caurina TaxID=311401 RepID=A0A8D0FXM6_STROC